jgi:hypothetical protein
VDQSTGAAGVKAPEGSTDTSELAASATEALAAVDGTAGAPAALPSGAAAGVQYDTAEVAVEAAIRDALTNGEAPEPTAEDVEKLVRAMKAIGDGVEALPPPTAIEFADLSGQAAEIDRAPVATELARRLAALGPSIEDAELTADGERLAFEIFDAATGRGVWDDVGFRLFGGACARAVQVAILMRVFPGDNLWRGGRYFTVGETQTFAPTDLTPQQLLNLLNERRFNLEWIEAE